MSTTKSNNNKNSPRLDSSGLRFNIWFYFVIFSLCIVAIVWMFEFVFLRIYFNSMRFKEMEKQSEMLVESFYHSNHIQQQIDEVAYSSGVVIVVYNEANAEQQLFFSASFIDNTGAPLVSTEELKGASIRLKDSGKNVATYYNTIRINNNDEIRSLVLCRRFNDGRQNLVLYMNSPMAALQGVTNVLSAQLFMVTMISLVLAFALSLFMSSQLSKPIIKMSSAARKLATGNYNIVFEGNGYTEIDELCDTLNYATTQLSNTDKMRKDLVANVSHDLKTPLTLIRSYAEMVRDLSGDNKQKREEHLNVIIDETERLTVLVNEMVKLSKLESNKEELDLTTFNLSELVTKVYEHFKINTTKDNYVFETSIEPELYVIADEKKIEQVIYNLVSNAVNYAGKEKWIKLSLTALNKKVRFDVFDHGVGIKEEELDLIWDRYYRSSDKRKRETVGTGLGLNISKTILTRHEAEYGVNSKVGEGSNFFFELKQFVKPDTNIKQ